MHGRLRSKDITVGIQGAKLWIPAVSPARRVTLVAALLLSACTSSGENGQKPAFSAQGGNHPPVIRSVLIRPAPLVLSGPLTVLVQAQDQDQDTIRFQYRWFANNKLVAERAAESVESDLFKRGDKIRVEVVPSDGKVEGALFTSEELTVQNTPPIVSYVLIEPDEQSFARRVVAKVDIADPDGDTITIGYRWKRNNEVVKEGMADDLDITNWSAKDVIQVEVIASDGIMAANPVSSKEFALNNTAPRVTSSPATIALGGLYEYHVTAKDYDADPISYALEAAPVGMTIDSQSGLIRWMPTAGTTGSHHVRVVVRDGRGGFATQEFDLSLSTATQPS